MPVTAAAGSGQDPGTFRCALASASANGFHPRAGWASLRMRFGVALGWPAAEDEEDEEDETAGRPRRRGAGGFPGRGYFAP